ncbi:MAG: hypothetical protein ACRESZ_01425 [Methylococcales bacterium]
MPGPFNRFVVYLFDVLGFESRFNALRLDGMLDKYVQLVQTVDKRNDETELWFGKMNFSEGAYWTSESDARTQASSSTGHAIGVRRAQET